MLLSDLSRPNHSSDSGQPDVGPHNLRTVKWLARIHFRQVTRRNERDKVNNYFNRLSTELRERINGEF